MQELNQTMKILCYNFPSRSLPISIHYLRCQSCQSFFNLGFSSIFVDVKSKRRGLTTFCEFQLVCLVCVKTIRHTAVPFVALTNLFQQEFVIIKPSNPHDTSFFSQINYFPHADKYFSFEDLQYFLVSSSWSEFSDYRPDYYLVLKPFSCNEIIIPSKNNQPDILSFQFQCVFPPKQCAVYSMVIFTQELCVDIDRFREHMLQFWCRVRGKFLILSNVFWSEKLVSPQIKPNARLEDCSESFRQQSTISSTFTFRIIQDSMLSVTNDLNLVKILTNNYQDLLNSASDDKYYTREEMPHSNYCWCGHCRLNRINVCDSPYESIIHL